MADRTPADLSRIHPVPLVPVPDRERPRPHLPLPLTSFVGREREVVAACDILRRPGVRLVTLTGPGGVGKTRLAIRVATEVANDFPDGVWFVALAPVRDATLVAATLAQTLGIGETPTRSIEEGLRAFLRERRALLVLDNLEHLLDAGPLIAGLLSACPSLTMLATSRAVLRVSGEHGVAVPPLPVSPVDSASGRDRRLASDAVRLFVERASAARSDFTVTETEAPTVTAICEKLDGLPLAIELAAARVTSLSLTALLTLVERRLALLTGGPRDQPVRLRSMRDAIAWSHDLLTPEEQALFRRLAVFVGGFTLEAAEAVDGGRDVLDTVTSLAANSLVRQAERGNAAPEEAPRFVLLETIREFALDQLAASGDEAEVRGRHAEWCLRLAERAEAAAWSSEQRAWFDRLQADHDNVGRRWPGCSTGGTRQGCAWPRQWVRSGSSGDRSARPAPGSTARWQSRRRTRRHRRYGPRCSPRRGRSRSANGTPARRGAARGERGAVAGGGRRRRAGRGALATRVLAQSTTAGGLAQLEDALALLRKLGHRLAPYALMEVGVMIHRLGDDAGGVALIEEALAHFRRHGDEWGSAACFRRLAWMALDRGEEARAVALARAGAGPLLGARGPGGDHRMPPPPGRRRRRAGMARAGGAAARGDRPARRRPEDGSDLRC